MVDESNSYKKFKIAVLVSGSGSNLQAIIDSIQSGYIPETDISIVISSKEGVFAIERCKKHNINYVIINPKEFPDRKQWAKKMIEVLKENDVDLICMAGFLIKLEPEIIQAFPNKIINIHPSLLPKFGGKGMYGLNVHKAVLDAGEKESGCSVHFADEEFDTGPIIMQRKVPVFENDTPEILSHRVLEQEHQLYPEVIRLIKLGKVEIIDKKVIIKDNS